MCSQCVCSQCECSENEPPRAPRTPRRRIATERGAVSFSPSAWRSWRLRSGALVVLDRTLRLRAKGVSATAYARSACARGACARRTCARRTCARRTCAHRTCARRMSRQGRQGRQEEGQRPNGERFRSHLLLGGLGVLGGSDLGHTPRRHTPCAANPPLTSASWPSCFRGSDQSTRVRQRTSPRRSTLSTMLTARCTACAPPRAATRSGARVTPAPGAQRRRRASGRPRPR